MIGLMVVAGAGCIVPDLSGGKPVIEYDGRFNIVDSSFEMDGDVRFSRGGSDRESVADVSVCLYGSDGALISESYLGTVSGDTPVRVSSDSIPEYVVFHAPAVGSEIATTYYGRVYSGNATYRENLVSTYDELPEAIPVEGRESVGCPGA